jgi:hypothetical protein
MSAAERHNGRTVIEGSTYRGTCCITGGLARARSLLRFCRVRPSSSAVAALWREEVMCNRPRTEPSLDELFRDVAMQLLMRRDGVRESDVRALLGELRDARAVTPGGAACERGASIGADQAPDREENIVSSRSIKSADATRFPIRFI